MNNNETNKHEHHQMAKSEKNTVEYLKFFGVIAGISLVTFFLYGSLGYNNLDEAMRLFMGVFLVVFGSFKLIGYSMFTVMFADYDPIAKQSKLYAKLYPFIEVGLGLLYLFGFLSVFRDVAVIFLLGIGSIGVFKEVYIRKTGVHCACLGNIIKLPLSTVSLFEDVLMVGMAVYMLVI